MLIVRERKYKYYHCCNALTIVYIKYRPSCNWHENNLNYTNKDITTQLKNKTNIDFLNKLLPMRKILISLAAKYFWQEGLWWYMKWCKDIISFLICKVFSMFSSGVQICRYFFVIRMYLKFFYIILLYVLNPGFNTTHLYRIIAKFITYRLYSLATTEYTIYNFALPNTRYCCFIAISSITSSWTYIDVIILFMINLGVCYLYHTFLPIPNT